MTEGQAKRAPHQIGFVLFPDVTQLDFTGPLQVMSRIPNTQTHIIAADLQPVPSDCGLGLVPTTTFAACPNLDVLCVPGGFGVVGASQDAALVEFVARQAAQARYVTSVCTGAFVLGAAGLLKGRRATTHWAYRALLPEVGAIPAEGRVVRDGPLITAGGVTAGVDFGLEIAAELAGREAAEAIQLAIEYDPAPPFQSGHPDRASEAVLARVTPRYAASVEQYRAVLASINLSRNLA
ncbi:MAG: DJ-1/PfpI family protein [Pseudomonadota bacterium]